MNFYSLSELVRYMESAFALKFYSGAAVLRKGVLKVLAVVFGGALYLLSVVAKRIWKNRFVTTCDVQALDGFGAEYGIPHKAATFARGYVTVTLEDGVPSATIPADTYFVDSVSGKEFRTLAPSTITSSALTVLVIASDAGSDSNLDADTGLSFRDATPTGLEDTAVVDDDGIKGGYSVEVHVDGEIQEWGETADEYRARLLNRIQNPPQGGSENDYKQWAERFSFVSDSYIKSGEPRANCVAVALANYNADVTLNADEVSQVEEYIFSDSRRPITADVRVFSVTPVSFTITAAVTPSTTSVKQSVSLAVQNFLKDLGPGASASFEACRVYVLANSLADTFTISYVTRDYIAVSNFKTNFNVSNELAEVGTSTVNFTSAE
jgi:uncharacterized phage protein gp47/JayE